MKADKNEILVFADWQGLSETNLMGTLLAQQAKGKKTLSNFGEE